MIVHHRSSLTDRSRELRAALEQAPGFLSAEGRGTTPAEFNSAGARAPAFLFALTDFSTFQAAEPIELKSSVFK